MALPARRRALLNRTLSPQRLVLDTNVWLDWLVFADPNIAPIRDAHRCKAVDIVIDDDCTRELQRVLAYPALSLDAEKQAECLRQLRDCTIAFRDPISPLCASLPKCRDGDDQKFLELACSAGAHWLLTRDKALLAVNRRKLQIAGFRVALPEQFAP